MNDPKTRDALDLGKVLLRALRVGLHRRVSRLPASRAHLVRVGLHVLHRLQDAQGLVDAAAEGQVVDGGVLDDTLAVDQEEAAQGDAVGREDAVGLADLLLEVGDERVGEVAEATCC